MPMPLFPALMAALCLLPAGVEASGPLATAPTAPRHGDDPGAAGRLPRSLPFPAEMQGHWADRDDPATRLVIAAGEVVYAGQAVAYDTKQVERRDGALTVRLAIDDPAEEDAFQRRSVTGLVLSPDGRLFAYNVKFASEFVRVAGP